ncbi:hypothetical protein [Kitasatospora sp. DSM 101779]|uniref:hypothetical protein n=1 Tax=Kitasatospora sp. DSM 101779 TaxID=2853165 RepID=UPI0021DA621B|nr:hypothetical protein [Kitasatospora sp. DSM 101779]MCU7820671.1 hypothetical protein [Kitasatospora sp. DSM 101779]
MSGHYGGPGVGRTGGGGCGCAVLLLLPGWFVAGYLLALPAVLPWVMAASTTPQPPLQAPQRAVLWAISGFTALLLGWMAGGRGRPRPVALLVRAVLIGAAAGSAALASPAAVRAALAGQSFADPATRAAGEHMLAATLGTVASAVAAAVCFYVVRWWGRRHGGTVAPPRPVRIPVRQRTTTRRPAPGEVWLAEIPLHEDRRQVLRHYCVVLQSHASHATVLQITSQSKDHRDDFIKMPNDGWDFVSGKDHWLELRRRDVPYRQFLKSTPQGLCPPVTWQEIVRAGA